MDNDLKFEMSATTIKVAGIIGYALIGLVTYGHLMAGLIKWCSENASHGYRCDIDYLGPFIGGATWPLYWPLHIAPMIF